MFSIFRKKKKPSGNHTAQKELRWKIITRENVAKNPELIRKIYQGEWDGFVYRGFFSEAECKSMLEGVANATTDAYTETPFGRVIGKRLDAEDGNFQKLPLDNYFRYTAQFRAELPGILGIDFEDVFHSGIRPMCGEVQPAVPVDDEGRVWNPATIRVARPGHGGIQTHVGNEFNEKMADIRHLSKFALVHDQLSYFFLLQAPEAEGQLVLYDALWDDTKEALAQDYPTAVRLVESRKGNVIDMRAGDLVIFAGGRIWHQVRDVAGGRDRITLGGFMAYSKDGEKLYHWS